MEIKLTNTLGRKKEVFKPIENKTVKMYTCGPTVYNYAHIGNLRAYVFADLLRRVFEANGYKVKEVINITDVGHLTSNQDEGEDKVEKEAEKEGKSVWEIANFYTKAFFEDLESLNIEPATIYSKATEHIADMIEFIKKLEKKGYTYLAEGNVYFDTSKFKDYGKMAGLNLSPEAAESRVEQDPNKKHPFDFVLWFTKYKYKSHEMQWDSPWGKGFPGWHIECSAMASKYLGEHIDIHTGGIDHIPVHHTNEIAQSEAAFGHKWVNYWLHNDFLVIKNGEKMAKSTGQFIRLQTIIDKGYDPMDYRYYLLGGHYRSQMLFSWEALDHARNSLNRMKTKVAELLDEVKESKELSTKASEYKNNFLEAVNDDLNTAKTLAILWEILDSKELKPTDKLKLAKFADSIFGLELLTIKKEEIPANIEELAKKRQSARENGNFQEADELRKEIEAKGYEVLDSKEGYKINKRSNIKYQKE